MTQLNDDFLDLLVAEAEVPVGKTLSMLVRPSFIASPGKTYVWGDWSAIEARVLPWLSGSPGGQAVLDIFEVSDHDKTQPDIYMRTACALIGEDPMYWWACYRGEHGEVLQKQAEYLRQGQGKVPVLSLGFGGGLGALQAMAINYGVFLDDAKGQWVVDTWRATNPWARAFWGSHDRDGSSGLWGAANQALENPGEAFTAGRVAYVYDKNYLGGTLFCGLPCGRLLTYPDIRWRTRSVKDKRTGEMKDVTALWFKKGYGWSALWYGKLAENVTQATAGSILREVLVWLDPRFTPFPDLINDGNRMTSWMPVVGHTHDEAVTEPAEDRKTDAARVLKQIMEHRADWRLDLPLVAEITEKWYYSKSRY